MFLFVHNCGHLVQIVSTTHKSDFLKIVSHQSQIITIIPICLGKILHLLQQDLADYLHIIGLGVLTQLE